MFRPDAIRGQRPMSATLFQCFQTNSMDFIELGALHFFGFIFVI